MALTLDEVFVIDTDTEIRKDNRTVYRTEANLAVKQEVDEFAIALEEYSDEMGLLEIRDDVWDELHVEDGWFDDSLIIL